MAKQLTPKIPKPPVLKPGTTADVPKFSKFGEIIQKLHGIKTRIANLKPSAPSISKLEKSQAKMQSNLKVDQLVDYINKHCGFYVKEMQKANQLLYRGAKSNESKDRYAFIGNSRANRRPRDSNAVAAKEFDKILTKLGFEALRKNSIFTTSNISGTLQYGTRYIIFPLDSAKFTYTDHRDVVLNTGSEQKWFTFSFKDKKLEAHIMKTLSEILVEAENYTRKLQSSDNYVNLMPIIYHYSDLIFYLVTIQNTKRFQSLRGAYQQALNIPDIATNEHYRIFNKFKEFIAPYMPKLKKSYDLERFKEIYNPQNTELWEAIDTGVEIYISGHYLALRATQFETIIKEKILGKKYG